MKKILLSILVLLAFAPLVFGNAVDKPYDFQDRTVAAHDQINANFDVLYDYINNSLAVIRITTKTSNVTLTVSEAGLIKCSGNTTLTLPAITNSGYIFYIVKTDSSSTTCTVDGNDGQIEESDTQTLTTAYEKLTVVSDGVRYLILSGSSGGM